MSVVIGTVNGKHVDNIRISRETITVEIYKRKINRKVDRKVSIFKRLYEKIHR